MKHPIHKTVNSLVVHQKQLGGEIMKCANLLIDADEG